jgi:hypothetical protein
VLIVAGLAGATWQLWPSTMAIGQPAAEPVAAPKQSFAYRGALSCASNACHGATDSATDTQRTDPLFHAFTTVMAGGDKHKDAYAILLTDRSKTIAKNYGEKTAAHESKLCLSCHSTVSNDAGGSPVALTDGVGCEKCHGPAEKWLAVHFQNSWKALSPAEKKAQYGFNDTKDLRTRAQLCSDCHVGTGDFQVDHDLYAAGHPRLFFELSSYLLTMPPHWSVSAEKKRMPDAAARTWLVGQVVSAESALALLGERVKAAEDNKKPWPEFAEYSCYACHHNLRPNLARQEAGYPNRAPGVLPWNEWYFAFFRGESGLAGPEFGKALDALAAEMQKPIPERKTVAEQVATAQNALKNSTLVQNGFHKPLDAATVRDWLEKVRAGKVGCAASWDCDTQRFLSLAALYNGLTDLGGKDPETLKKLQGMVNPLRFPKGFDSPGNWPPMKTAPQK